MKLSDIIRLPKVWARLIGNNAPKTPGSTAKTARKLSEQMAERQRKMDVLKRLGLGAHAVENIYPPPLDPSKGGKKDD